MTPLRYVIVDFTATDFVTDEPLFWSNEDGWVSLDTPSVLKATATETEEQGHLPMGGDVQWIPMSQARRTVEKCRLTAAAG
jgi:hypothetical protein